jgi:hypothetical protein
MQEARLAREEASQLRVQLMKAEGQRLDAVVTLKKADTTNQVGVAWGQAGKDEHALDVH